MIVVFLLRNPLIGLLELLCMLLPVSPLLPLWFFVFNSWHFNYDVSFNIWVHLDWNLLCFLNLQEFPLNKLRKFSVIIFSNIFSFPCSIYPPPGIPMMKMFLCFMFSWSPLKLSSYFFSHFSFSYSIWVFLSHLSSNSLFESPASYSMLVISASVFFIWDIVFFNSGGFFSEFWFHFACCYIFHSVPCGCYWLFW